MNKIINGTEIALAIREEIKEGVAKLKAERGVVPGLATVLVGAMVRSAGAMWPSSG